MDDDTPFYSVPTLEDKYAHLRICLFDIARDDKWEDWDEALACVHSLINVQRELRTRRTLRVVEREPEIQ